MKTEQNLLPLEPDLLKSKRGDINIRHNKRQSCRVARRFRSDESLRRDDVDDTVHNKGSRGCHLLLGRTSDVATDDRHDDSVVDARA